MVTRRLAVLLVLPLALGLASGCKKKSHRHHVHQDSVYVETQGDFFWEADVLFYDSYEEYEWVNEYPDAIVDIEAFEFRGALTVEIYDHFDHLVYADTFYGKDEYLSHFDVTAFGEPGIWIVVLINEDVDGLVTVQLE